EISWGATPNASSYDVCYSSSSHPDPCSGDDVTVVSVSGTGARLAGLPLDTAYFAVRARDGTAAGRGSVAIQAPPLPPRSLQQHVGLTPDDLFAQASTSLATAGDVDGDGNADFIVGSPEEATLTGNAGSAYVYSGLDGSLLFQRDGENNGDLFGQAVSSAGDV